MGYDNNKPLTGVTGGGLPAEIWKEVMVRVHQDLPPRPLPMIRPAAPPEVQFSDPAEKRSSGKKRKNRKDKDAENILLEVLGAILGKN